METIHLPSSGEGEFHRVLQQMYRSQVADPSDLTLDFSGVTALSSYALTILFDLVPRLVNGGHIVIVAELSDALYELFGHVGLDAWVSTSWVSETKALSLG
jgi:anti-anti-sigma regulatory factor